MGPGCQPQRRNDPIQSERVRMVKVVRIAILLLESYDSTNPRQPVDPNRTVDPTRRDLRQKRNLQFFLEARLC